MQLTKNRIKSIIKGEDLHTELCYSHAFVVHGATNIDIGGADEAGVMMLVMVLIRMMIVGVTMVMIVGMMMIIIVGG